MEICLSLILPLYKSMRAYGECKSDAVRVSVVWNERRSREETHSDE